MSFSKRLLHEPIIHFLLAPDLRMVDDSTIVIDRDTILNFMQFRANAFDPDNFALTLDAMSDVEVETLINAYVVEEVLYREAQSLNLDASDYLIRQRMVQKMNLMLGDLAGAEAAKDEAELKAYFQTNIGAYRIKPSTTFTHVYFNRVILRVPPTLELRNAPLLI